MGKDLSLSQKTNAYIAAVAAALIFGFSGTLIKVVSITSEQLAFMRFGIPLLIIFAIERPTLEFFRKTPFPVYIASLLNGFRLLFYIVGLRLAPLSSAVLVLYTWPAFVYLFSVVAKTERFSLRKIALIGLSFFGVLLIFSDLDGDSSQGSILGLWYILFESILYSVSVVIFKRYSQRFSSMQLLMYHNLAGGFIYLPFAGFLLMPLDLTTYALSFSYSIGLGFTAFWMFFYALKRIDASTVANINYLEVIVAIGCGIAFFGESLSMIRLVGGFLICLSAYASRP